MVNYSFVDFKKYKDIQSALLSSFKNQVRNAYYHYSALWKQLISDRNETKELSDLLIALNSRATFTDGVAGVLPERKQDIFIDHYKTILDKKSLLEYPMSWLGAPSVLDFDGQPASMSYIHNLQLFLEIQELLSNFQIQRRDLHIVEIGAGYGGLAYFLLKSGIAASYTIIDLPENLKINTFYLTQTFQDHSYTILPSPEPTPQHFRNKLNFVSPGNISALNEWQFDLAINSDSLGEMPKSTAQSYVKWIHEHLTEGGYFFGKNGHSRGTDCVQFPHEYGFQSFNLITLKPPKSFSSLFDDFSHYILLQKKSDCKQNTHQDVHLDVICSLYATGLQEELNEISNAFSQNTINEQQVQFLTLCHQFFSEKSLDKKFACLEKSFNCIYSVCLNYLAGITKFLMGDLKEAEVFLTKYLTDCQSPIGEAYALMMMSKYNPPILSTTFKCGASTRYAIDEIFVFHSYKWPFNRIAFKLREDILRKKINYPTSYSPSILLRIKNLIFNLRERGAFRFTR